MKKLFIALAIVIVGFASMGNSVSAGSNPQSFVVNDVLPATEQLKIAWTETNADHFASDEEKNLITMDNSFIFAYASESAGEINTKIDGVRVAYYVPTFYEYIWRSNCGDDGTSSCGTDKWIIIDTTEWSESKRTIASVDSWADDVGLTYENLVISYTITYNLDGGVNHENNPDTFVASDLPITLLDPSKSGYTFIAWHDSAQLDSPITEITTEDDITLYAEFEEITPADSIFDALSSIVGFAVGTVTGVVSGITSIIWTEGSGLSFFGTLMVVLFGVGLVKIGLNFVKKLLSMR